MPKNIVICCDGTGNQINADLSNVLKLFRVVRKNDEQTVFYDPGVGTIGSSEPWARFKANARGVWGLLTGYGLDANVLDAYRFLVDVYEDGDQIYLFGFSRGAYTIRVLAGFIRLVGLVEPSQRNLSDYALAAYKKAAEKSDFEIAWRFERVMSTRRVAIKFMGVWDTVSSLIVPRPDRFYLPSLQELPYTKSNEYVAVVRQAIAIDERRRMFRIDLWEEKDQPKFKPNPFDPAEPKAQDIKQVWFSGVHSDVGGGYPETESGPAKYPLQWLIEEAVEHGLLINTAMFNHLVCGRQRKGATRDYVPPDFKVDVHDSMNAGWRVLEYLPKRETRRDWTKRSAWLGWYLPQSEPRFIPDGAWVHHSVLDRWDDDVDYRPENLPDRSKVCIEGPRQPKSPTEAMANSPEP
jgi:uncharacterized protein (DUF2235 family)